MTILARRISILSLSLLPWVWGCADDETSDPCQDYAGVTPGGSFKDDVMPLFSRSCALAASCHQGDPGDGQEGLGLGPSNAMIDMSGLDQATIDAIHAQLLNDAPLRSPLPLIKANDPVGSWLMAKIEYDTDNLSMCSECKGDCGVFMPQGSSPDSGYSRPERDLIAGWILDGAQNN